MGVDTNSVSDYNIIIMEIDRTPVRKYILINWDRPFVDKILNPKPVKMTEKEACFLNKAMAINRQNKRYVIHEV